MRFLALLALTSLFGCNRHKAVLRSDVTYQAELDQYHQWATRQAVHLRRFIEGQCECVGSRFKSDDCAKAADFVLTIEARADWHKQMSLWNAGMLEQEPPAQPPEIAPLSCPLPPAPAGE